jgi:16S rRNA (uracil1498-N3)-methyltransferase
LTLEHLSNIELYYTTPSFISKSQAVLSPEETKHAVKVMRNSVGDDLYITDGNGSIFLSKIISIERDSLAARILKTFKYNNEGKELVFCIPKLKNPERLKLAVEKSVELGITRFKIFESKHTISKTSNKKRLQKIAVSAMKQSLRPFLPEIEFDTLSNILKYEGTKILFDQNAMYEFNISTRLLKPVFFIFGPEGGFDRSELVKSDYTRILKLANNRLRTETAVIKCASLLNL